MRSGTVEVIREIARIDRKTNTEMALKVCEEAGELARAVLIKVGADGTHYRQASDESMRADIIEEIADVSICIMALAEKYKVTEQELDTMLQTKMVKWTHVLTKGCSADPEKKCEYITGLHDGKVTTICRYCRVPQ